MSRPQSGSTPDKQQTRRAKAEVVHKKEALRQAEASWNKQAREVQSLNILDRCKKLNEFLSKGLLGQIYLDEEVFPPSILPAKPAAGALGNDTVPAAAHVHTPAARQNSRQDIVTVAARRKADSSAVTPRQPLTSHIIAKESAALLDLLGEAPAEESTANSDPDGSTPALASAFIPLLCRSPTTAFEGTNPPAEVNFTAATRALPLSACSTGSITSITQQQRSEAATHTPPTVNQRPPVSVAATEDDFELVGLLNSQGSNCLAALQSVEAGASCSVGRQGDAAPVDFRQVLKHQRAAITIQRHVRGLLVRRFTTLQVKQQFAIQRRLHKAAATCLQRAFRCMQALRMLSNLRRQRQQEQQLQLQQQPRQERPPLSIVDKQESINAAWRGYYLTHGQAAACVIQSYWRAYQTKRLYQQQQAAAAVLQAVSRGWLVRRRTAADMQMQMQERHRKLLLSESLQLQRGQRKEAALVLQSCGRGWLARKLLQQLKQQQQAMLAAAEASAATAGAAAPACQMKQPVAECPLSSWLEPCAQPVHTDKPFSEPDTKVSSSTCCSNNSSSGDDHSISTPRQISSRGSRSSRNYRYSTSVRQDPKLISASTSGKPQPQQAEGTPSGDDVWPYRRSSGSAQRAGTDSGACNAMPTEVNALIGRQLVIRSAADMRTATQHGNGSSCAGAACTEQLAREMVWRAGELQVGEEQQRGDLAVRATMAGSSFRKLQEAMVAVKSRRDIS